MLIRLWGTAKLPFQSTGTRLVGVKSLSEKPPDWRLLRKPCSPEGCRTFALIPAVSLWGSLARLLVQSRWIRQLPLKRAKFSRNTIVYRDMRLDREDEGPLACALN